MIDKRFARYIKRQYMVIMAYIRPSKSLLFQVLPLIKKSANVLVIMPTLALINN